MSTSDRPSSLPSYVFAFACLVAVVVFMAYPAALAYEKWRDVLNPPTCPVLWKDLL